MRTILFILLISCCSTIHAENRNDEFQTRPVVIQQDGNEIHCRVLVDKVDVEADLRTVYHWFQFDQIHRNRGGYSGVLLHGICKMFNADRQLLSEGKYDLGKKAGVWKYWNEKGELVQATTWKNGLQDGLDSNYHSMLTWEKANYKSNQLHGKRIIQTTDSLFVETYRHGKMIKKSAEPLIKPVKQKEKRKKREPKEPKIKLKLTKEENAEIKPDDKKD